MTSRTAFYCRCGARLVGGDRVGHKCPTVVEAAQTVVRMLELGDERLLASDGPAGGQLPDLSPDEWGVVYRACKTVAKGLTKADVSCLVCGADMAHIARMGAYYGDPGDWHKALHELGELIAAHELHYMRLDARDT